MKKQRILAALVIVLLGTQLPLSRPAYCQSDQDHKFLLLYFTEDDLYVESSTRGRKSLAQAAENITIVTAQEMKLMNAHTLADALNTVTGIQLFMTGGPGSIAQASIQGSENRHVAVFVDGIPLNNLSDNVVDIGSFPVQNVERIEIIKGPASSAWGSALGGVINIITKSGRSEELSGVVSASYGKGNTGDFRMEASGKGERLGYYVTARRLETDGFRPHNDFSGNNAFAKFAYDLTNSTRVRVSTSYDRFARGIAEIPDYDLYLNNKAETIRSSLSLNSAINRETMLDLGFWHLHQEYDVYNYRTSTGSPLSTYSYEDTGYGSSAKLTWKRQEHNLVLGADLDSRKLESNALAGNEHIQRKYAFYLNDTISVSRFSFTPGIRRDQTDTNGDFNSPSLGMTYKPVETVLLRAYAARGFSIPPLSATFGGSQFTVPNPDLRMERVKSYQAGVETTAVPFVWLKLDVYRHDITDAIITKTLPGPQFIAVNGGQARRQGLEIELRTKEVYHAFLSAGAAFMNTRDAETGRTVPNTPQRTYDLGLHYGDGSLKALVTGHYIYWNSAVFNDGKYKAMIVDIHAAKTLYSGGNNSLELFVDVHNIFNGAQYPIALYKNPGRWSEAGIRYSF